MGGSRVRGSQGEVDCLEEGFLDGEGSAKFVAMGCDEFRDIHPKLDGRWMVASEDMIKGLARF